VALIHDSRTLSLQDIRSSIKFNRRRISSEGTFFTSSPHGKMVYKADHRFGDHAGALSIHTTKPIVLDGEQARLSRVLTPWPYRFDLYTGTIQLESQATWDKENRLLVSTGIKLENSGGHYGELVFSGLSLEHNLQLLPEIVSEDASTIRIKHIDSGVIASNMRASLQLIKAATGSLPQLAVTDMKGDIFDGTISTDELVYDFNLDKNSFTLKAENIDLAQVVATQQLRDISVSGRVDGTLPVEIDDSGISVKQGAFLNDIRHGTIRYNPASGTDQLKQNPLTAVALDALRDFRYSHLSANINYTPRGMLKLDLQLRGTSPELDTKRPVHLNINTEQNLLSLLKSLRYAEGVSAVIDKRVRRQYESNWKGKAE
ncbi:MAG: YdbH domain-containing protein, partial [Gammaproteobacteria bacterium]|nr:YdbH domain-containing protein [Gammaproteobacteria bacterium]